ncbi:MAG TPA: hypothetical protein VGC30_15265, partial [Dokdonella sp.]
MDRPAVAPDSRPSRVFAAQTLAVGALVLAAAAWLGSSLVAIANFAFRYPAFDQYRLYPGYLRLPFPANALQSENGHHPVLPTLVRLAELRWFAADQRLQIAVGVGTALATLLAIVWVVLRERSTAPAARAAACLLAVVALFWLGNARTLMHGYEAVHVYPTTLLGTLALLAAARARAGRAARRLALAGLACAGATFCFGGGLASFVAAALVAALGGARARALGVLGAAFAAAMLVYVFVLPGDAHVRAALSFDPLGVAAAMARWLSSPWMHAWLGDADAIARASSPHSAPVRVLAASAHVAALPFGADANMSRERFAVGALGIVAYACALAGAWRTRATLGSARLLAIGLATFTLATAAIVCLARVDLFTRLPGQVIADRYSPWPCLFWFALALYALAGAAATRARGRDARRALVAGGLVVFAFLPSQRTQAIWSSLVYRRVQLSAVAAQLGIGEDRPIYGPSDASPALALDTLDLLKRAHLSMFAEPAYALVEHGWQAPDELPPAPAGAAARVVR